MIPIWYLDIDGVINMVRLPHDPPDFALESYREVRIKADMGLLDGGASSDIPLMLTIRYDQNLVDFISRVHAEGRVEICWLTTWQRRAMEVFAPQMGLPELRLPRVDFQGLAEGQQNDLWWHKWASVRHHAEEDHHDERTVIWTDDDIADHNALIGGGINEWVRQRKWNNLRSLVISPDPRVGLIPAHRDMIEELL